MTPWWFVDFSTFFRFLPMPFLAEPRNWKRLYYFYYDSAIWMIVDKWFKTRTSSSIQRHVTSSIQRFKLAPVKSVVLKLIWQDQNNASHNFLNFHFPQTKSTPSKSPSGFVQFVDLRQLFKMTVPENKIIHASRDKDCKHGRRKVPDIGLWSGR